MTFLDILQAHRGSLIKLKSRLFWHKKGRWENNPDQICLVLDARPSVFAAALETHGIIAAVAENASYRGPHTVGSLLLIDGSLEWVWIDKQSTELITSEPLNDIS